MKEFVFSKRDSTKILIVGSGIAASVIAEQLLSIGTGPITMLEAGGPFEMRDRRTWLDFVMGGKNPYGRISDIENDYEANGIQPWKIQGGRLLARGGSTIHWGGWCPRMKPEDFELKTRTGTGLDWPISYEKLEPYYVRAEHYLQVAGDSFDKNPFRSAPYLFEAPAFTLTDNVMIRALDRLGISYMHIPIARNAKPINGLPQCVTTGTCTYCPIGARFSGDQPLDRLLKTYGEERFRLLTNSPVREIIIGHKKEAVAVEYVDVRINESRRIDAETIILCAGSLETPKLLLSSRSKEWPNGIGNDWDQVGRYLIANPYFFMRGRSPQNPLKLQEELFIPTIGSRHWDTPEYQHEGKFILNRAPSPNVKLAGLMSQGHLSPQIELDTLAEQTLELQGTIQTFSTFENRVSLAKGLTSFGLPRTLINTPVPACTNDQAEHIYARMRAILEAMGYTMPEDQKGMYPQRGDHAMCTCRMSQSPSEGVVDSSMKVHGMENLFIVSNAVFPSGAAANPTLTLVALAMRFADAL